MVDAAVLASGAKELSVELSREHLQRYERYMAVLMEWSQRVSLTAVKDPEGIQRRHFLESLAILPVLSKHGLSLKDSSLVDVGSGAGVPGIPLKIIEPSLRLTLVEAKQRKAEFLAALLSDLRLSDVEVVTRRAEDAAHDPQYREQYDYVTAKALAPLRTLLELTLPFARMGGLLIAPKGREAQIEVQEARNALETLSGAIRAIEPIPLSQPEQRIVLVDKELPTPDRFPRRPGMPAKRPL